MNDELKECPSCGEELKSLDNKFCTFCGTGLDEVNANETEELTEESNEELSDEQKKVIRKSSNWILFLSISFVVFGTIFGFMNKSEADKAKANIAHFDSEMTIPTPIKGKTYTVGELRTALDKEVTFLFATNYFLGLIMFGLYFWSKKNPFAAMVTALTVYLSVIVLSAIIDPHSIYQGIIIKIFVITALINGIKVSINSRQIKTA